MQDISADYLRKHLGEVLDRAYYTGDEVKISRKGRTLGVFVPIERYEKRKEMLKKAFSKFMEEERATGRGEDFTEDEVMEDAVEALHEVRKLNSEND
jgi:prevent-host-death family protein